MSGGTAGRLDAPGGRGEEAGQRNDTTPASEETGRAGDTTPASEQTAWASEETAWASRALPPALQDRVAAFGRTYRQPPARVLLAAFGAAVARSTNTPDLTVLAEPPEPDRPEPATRPEPTTLAEPATRAPGPRPAPVRFRCADDPSLLRLLTQVNQAEPGAEPDPAAAAEPTAAPDVTAAPDLTRAPGPGGADAGLRLRVQREGGRLHWHVCAERSRYTGAELARLLHRVELFTTAALAEPTRPMSTHPVLLPAERITVVREWPGRDGPVPTRTVAEMITEVAGTRGPDLAVLARSGAMSYTDLVRAADAVRQALRAAGVPPGAVVGVHLARDLTLLPAMLGSWLAGCVHLPVNPSWPAARRRDILADAGARAVLVADGAGDTAGYPGDLAVLQVPRPTAGPPPGAGPGPEPTAGNLAGPAYVMYTSGSTGRPKGVAIGQLALANLILRMAEVTGLGPADRMLAASPTTFDISLVELLLPLVVGGTCVIADDDAAVDPTALAALIRTHRVSAVQTTPSVWAVLLDQLGVPLRLALAGGEALPPEVAQRLAAGADRALNVYGPTETTIWVTAGEVTGSEVTIGRPLRNTRAWVVDAWGQPCPPGTVGRLMIGGCCVAEGYLNRPDLTARAFLPGLPPLTTGTVYDTGDLAAWGPDGQLRLHGRVDDQLKIRGFRIEPGEIETLIRQVPGVRDSAVVGYRLGDAQTGLAAFVVPAAGRPADDPGLYRAIRHHLAQVLPAYSRPQLYRSIDVLPRSATGKLDRAGLSRQVSARPAPQAPAGEAPVAAVWREILGVPARDDGDFVALGGDSLGAARLIARVSRITGVDLSLQEFLARPTFGTLSAMLAGSRSQPSPLTRRQPTRPVVAVFFDRGAALPIEIWNSARDLCDLVFFFDGRGSYPQWARPVLGALAPCVDIAGMSDEELVAAVAGVGAAGVTTFSERCIRQVSLVADRLGLIGNDLGVAGTLTDKRAQRAAFQAAGVPSPRSVPVDTPGQAVQALAVVGLPAVLKPATGMASRETHRVSSEAGLAALAAEVLAADRGLGPFVLEELLVGDSGVAGPGWGDYVSVESVVLDGRIEHLTVTGKLPLAYPFRETGMMLPAPLPPAWDRAVREVAGQALAALGFRWGVSHTEVKLTADGPRVIEVNGRTGGYVSWLLRRGAGVDLLELAVRLSLGGLDRVPPVALDCTPFEYFPAPPVSARRLTAIDHVDKVRQLPGVDRVELLMTPGSAVDWRLGTDCHPLVIYGAAADLADLEATLTTIDATLSIRYEPG